MKFMLSNNKIYYEEIPYLRAIACFLVILTHVTVANYNHITGFFSDSVSLYVNQLSRYGTPVFAVISGFLLAGYLDRSRFKLRRFVFSRFVKIVIPFVLWSLFYIAFRPDRVGWLNDEWYNMLYMFMTGGAFGHLYFIAAVVQFYLIFPILVYCGIGRSAFLAVFIFSLGINFFWLSYSDLVGYDCSLGFICHRAFLLNWIGFFFGGIVLFLYYEKIKIFVVMNKWFVFLCFAMCVLLTVYQTVPGKMFNSSRSENLLFVPIFVLMVISCFSGWAQRSLFSSVLRRVGDFSMGIYLIHPAVLGVLKKILPAYFMVGYSVFFVALLTLSISYFIAFGLSRLPYSSFLFPLPYGARS